MPGYYGLEAGQSAVSDLLNWFVERVCKGPKSTAGASGAADATDASSRNDALGALHAELTAGAAALQPGESGLIALDWNNGNRDDPRGHASPA